ncbi:hypothetical protein AAFF_G00154550 [Aldrovandia affinis]|uniref:Uncharacterized protein n=1 Tax=Aldrovandia affinis TaxID=143900 RepID=A0AAD7T116_9TELE|nr:hypothetical protein AAFF_G00154550 [Aldrovandia affinis]
MLLYLTQVSLRLGRKVDAVGERRFQAGSVPTADTSHRWIWASSPAIIYEEESRHRLCRPRASSLSARQNRPRVLKGTRTGEGIEAASEEFLIETQKNLLREICDRCMSNAVAAKEKNLQPASPGKGPQRLPPLPSAWSRGRLTEQHGAPAAVLTHTPPDVLTKGSISATIAPLAHPASPSREPNKMIPQTISCEVHTRWVPFRSSQRPLGSLLLWLGKLAARFRCWHRSVSDRTNRRLPSHSHL